VQPQNRRLVRQSALETSLVKEALQQALAMRRPAAGLLHHSDRGIQYASSAFQALLHSFQIIPGMSAKGHCYDNAAMESFWSTLKNELIYRRDFQDLADVRRAVFDYIETFYNRRRLHSALGYRSLVEFEQQLTYNKNGKAVSIFSGEVQDIKTFSSSCSSCPSWCKLGCGRPRCVFALRMGCADTAKARENRGTSFARPVCAWDRYWLGTPAS
jgi:hypothetical protein